MCLTSLVQGTAKSAPPLTSPLCLETNMDNKNWQSLIPGCFAGMDAPFGVHYYDHQRAIKMMNFAFCQGARMTDITEEAKQYLKKNGCDEERIEYQLNLIKNFKPNPIKSKIKKKKAWLITWEGTNRDRENIAENIVNVFDSRVSSEKIKFFIENHYISLKFGSLEKASYASKRKENPFPVIFEKINGVPWEGKMTCGDNPFLSARIVKNLIILESGDGKRHIQWEEIPKPIIE